MLKRFFLVVHIFACVYASAQGTIKGKVTEADGKTPLDYATVRVMQKDSMILGTLTDLKGNFIFYPVPAGKYEVKIDYVGYHKILIKDIEIIGNEIKDFGVISMDLDTAEGKLLYSIVSRRGVIDVTQAVSIQVKGNRKNGSNSKKAINCPSFGYAPSYNDAKAEEYDRNPENRFIMAKNEPLSTFSIDVDAASYANVRRMINQGEKPPVDAVRVEEMINYFSYNYPAPTKEDPVKITTELGVCAWNTNHKLVRIGIKAREIPSENLPPSNFVFLIDVSGSMDSWNRLPLVKSSLKLLVNNLREKDRVAIVVYAGAAGQILPSTSGADKQKIIEVIDGLKAAGSTAGGEGIVLAYKVAQNNFITNGNNRVILCTDGDFNVGVSSQKELESLIEEKRKSGVYLTILGYGMGNYKDNKLQTLSQKGNGNHAYIDNLQEANRVLVHEFGGTLYTVAKDVKLQIEFNPAKVQAYRLIGYESRLLDKEDFNDDTKDAGEIGAGQSVTAFYEIIPVGVESNLIGSVDTLKYQKNQPPTAYTNSPDLLTVKLRYKQPNGNHSSKIEIPVLDNARENLSEDFRFAAAVALFGQLLKKSDFVSGAGYNTVIELAKPAVGKDEQGYRREFIRLVETAKGLE